MSERVWDFSCPDWEERIMAGKSLMPDLPLYEDEAAVAMSVFDDLRLPDVVGTPLLRDSVGEWFREIVVAVLGSRDPATNIRHVQELFAMLPKGSAKTTYGGLFMLTALILNERPRARFYLIAPSQSTADIAFDAIKGAIELDPDLSNRYWVRSGTNFQTIVDRLDQSELSIKTFSLQILNGPKPVGVLLDEVHLIASQPKAAKVMRQIRGGLQKNSEAFLLMTTTQSADEPEGIFKDELKIARDTRDGKLKDSRMLPILYEFPTAIAKDEAKWSNPEIWNRVMPNLGRGTRLETFVKEWNVEKTKGDEAKRLWASQHLNIQVGIGLLGDGWSGARFWEKETVIDERLQGEAGLLELIERSDVIVVGIDGGGLYDLLGMTVIGREKVTRRWLIWSRAWCHEVILEEQPEIAVKLGDLRDTGDLEIIPNDSDEDVQQVADICCQIRESGKLPEERSIGVDAVGISDIKDELVKRKFAVTTEEAFGHIISVGQGFRLMTASESLGRRVSQKKALHGGARLMRWCVANAKSEKRGNARVITKQASTSAKIDPFISMLNAAMLMAESPEPDTSVYEERGLRVA